ncbi:MAG: phosphodiesterase [Hyphomicrobiaceae bacterium]
MLIAQLSDTHIKSHGALAYGKIDTAAALRAAIQHINDLRPIPDLVLLTGDLTDNGTREQMDHCCELLHALIPPLFPIPGNHDSGANFADAFPKAAECAWPGGFSYMIEEFPVKICMLDSSVPEKPYGALHAECLARLEQVLDTNPDAPTLIAVHHPPIDVGIRHMDQQRLETVDELRRIIHHRPQVLAILCGHIHRTILGMLGMTPVVVAPSPAHAVTLDFNPSGPPTFIVEPPGILIHKWNPDPAPFGQLMTHTSYIGDFGSPHPFFDAAGNLIG